MKFEVILDRIEESVAVLTDKAGTVHSCSASLLPKDSKDGAPLYAELDAEGKIVSLEKRTVPEEKRNKRKLSDLFMKNPKNKNKF